MTKLESRSSLDPVYKQVVSMHILYQNCTLKRFYSPALTLVLNESLVLQVVEKNLTKHSLY